LNGGDGIDTVDYSSSPGIIDINILPTNYGGYGRGGGDANGDTFSSIENVKGSNFDDFISAQSITNVNNILDGGDGNDTILGDSGDDIIIGGLGADILYGGSLRSSWGADTFRYMSLAEILSNDRIGWFSEDDVIDLSFADADPSTTVRDPFHFSPGGVGQLQFINEHEVRVVGLSGTIYVGFADKGELFESDFLL
jgi:Ca2+-binding RTX toxin-like protein